MSELLKTRRRVLRLRAHNPDALEDYFHDAVIRVLQDGKSVEQWLPYIYRSVSLRIRYGREDQGHAPLIEDALPEQTPANAALKVDIERALNVLSPRQRLYIYLFFYEEWLLEEIAEQHHISVQAAHQVIQRALYQMKKVLTQKENT